MNSSIEEDKKQFQELMETIDNLLNQYEKGYVTIGQVDFHKEILTFLVISSVAEHDSYELLDQSPPWLTKELYAWCELYNNSGEFKIYSNIGVVDHTEKMDIFFKKYNNYRKNKT